MAISSSRRVYAPSPFPIGSKQTPYRVLLGHATLGTRALYSHVVTKTIRQITNLLDRLISKSQTGALPGVGVRIASLRSQTLATSFAQALITQRNPT